MTSSDRTEQSKEVRDGFLLISIDDHFAHYYSSVKAMLADKEPRPAAVEAFDSAGFRVVFGFDMDGHVISAWRTRARADRNALVARLDRVVDEAAGNVGRELQRFSERPPTDETVKRLETSRELLKKAREGDYAQRYEQLSTPPFGHKPPEEPDPGSSLHNCLRHFRCF